MFAATYLGLAITGIPVLGADSYLILHWSQAYTELTRSGLFYPRWIDTAFGGFGAPVFYYYPPFPFVVSDFFHKFLHHLGPDASYHAVNLMASVIGLLAMNDLLKHLHAPKDRRLPASILFGFSFYAYLDVYLRAARGEAFAMAILPMGILGLLLIREKRTSLRGLTVLAFAFAALLTTNIPTTLIFFLAAVVLFATYKPNITSLARAAAGFALGTWIAMAYVLPLIWYADEIPLGQINPAWFIFPAAGFFTTNHSPLFGASLVLLITAIGVLAAFWKARSEVIGALRWWVLAIIVLQLPFISSAIWHYVPGFGIIQSSIRLNVLLMLMLCIGYAMLQKQSARRFIKLSIMLGAVGMLLVTLPYLLRSFNFPSRTMKDDSYGAYEYFTKNRTISPDESQAFVLAHSLDPEAEPLRALSADEKLHAERSSANTTTLTAQLATPSTVRFHRFYFPTWQLQDELGNELKLSHDSAGRIMAQLPAGSFAGVLAIQKSAVETVGLIVSGFSIALLLGLSYLRRKRKSEEKSF